MVYVLHESIVFVSMWRTRRRVHTSRFSHETSLKQKLRNVITFLHFTQTIISCRFCPACGFGVWLQSCVVTYIQQCWYMCLCHALRIDCSRQYMRMIYKLVHQVLLYLPLDTLRPMPRTTSLSNMVCAPSCSKMNSSTQTIRIKCISVYIYVHVPPAWEV